ncbi:hypothetical protein QYE76_020688 [Lolium multiflorum]|uniref:AP2/ERF domain-containing protein n=1 Tax=Lolium multiflorum TaxID=4521 RepID=A0AAD8VRK0_LOLMU|nr:hypothetical protein QYE76_020688 [Lolium multiflorum]
MPRLASSSRYCRVSGTGYRGVRARPKGTYYAEIRDGGERIGLGTYETAHEAARAYDAVAWRLGRPRSSMNFHDVWTRQQAEDLAPPPYIRDERAAREWAARFPEAAENEHFRRRRAEKATRRAAKKEDRAQRRAEKATKRAFIEAQLAGPTTIGEDDPRWIDLFSSDPVSGTTPDSSDVEF